jgi:hypothetical protein
MISLFELSAIASITEGRYRASKSRPFQFGMTTLAVALPQHIGGFRNIDERPWFGQLAARTERDEEMRVVRCAASAIDARFGRPEADGRMKRERFHSILQQQSNIREHAFQFRTNSSASNSCS